MAVCTMRGDPASYFSGRGAERGNGGEAGQALLTILNPLLQRSPNLTARGLLWKPPSGADFLRREGRQR